MDQNVYKAQLILILADKICAAASIIGSVFIIRDIKKRWDRKKSNEYLPPTLYQLAHTAVADIGYSLFPHFLNSWLIPKETGYPFAAGNQATCIAQGYLCIFFLGATMAFRAQFERIYPHLDIRYLLLDWLTVCRGKQISELRDKYWTFFLYGFSWAVGLLFAALSWTIVIPQESGGWAYCMAAFGREPDTKWIKVWGIVGALYGIACVTLASFCTISLVRFIHRTEKRMDRFAVEGDSERKRKKTIAATRQGLLYITAQQLYLLPILFYCIAVAILDLKLPMWLWTLFACFKTLPGFVHSVIHFQPTYLKIRKQEDKSRLNALAAALDITVPGRLSLTSTMFSQSSVNIRSGQCSLPSQVNQSTNCELTTASLPQQPMDDSGKCGGTESA